MPKEGRKLNDISFKNIESIVCGRLDGLRKIDDDQPIFRHKYIIFGQITRSMDGKPMFWKFDSSNLPSNEKINRITLEGLDGGSELGLAFHNFYPGLVCETVVF